MRNKANSGPCRAGDRGARRQNKANSTCRFWTVPTRGFVKTQDLASLRARPSCETKPILQGTCSRCAGEMPSTRALPVARNKANLPRSRSAITTDGRKGYVEKQVSCVREKQSQYRRRQMVCRATLAAWAWCHGAGRSLMRTCRSRPGQTSGSGAGSASSPGGRTWPPGGPPCRPDAAPPRPSCP